MSCDNQPRMKNHPLVGYPRQLIQHFHCYPVYLANFRSIYKIMTRNSVIFRKILKVKSVSLPLKLHNLSFKRKI
jgi:hypothetical protein